MATLIASPAAREAALRRGLIKFPEPAVPRQERPKAKPSVDHHKFSDLFRALQGGCEAFAAPVPLAVGIREQIRALIGGAFDDEVVCAVLHWWTQSPAYLAALMTAPARVNLDGSVAGLIKTEHRQRAERQLAGKTRVRMN